MKLGQLRCYTLLFVLFCSVSFDSLQNKKDVEIQMKQLTSGNIQLMRKQNIVQGHSLFNIKQSSFSTS